jgi:hypothetical protein
VLTNINIYDIILIYQKEENKMILVISKKKVVRVFTGEDLPELRAFIAQTPKPMEIELADRNELVLNTWEVDHTWEVNQEELVDDILRAYHRNLVYITHDTNHPYGENITLSPQEPVYTPDNSFSTVKGYFHFGQWVQEVYFKHPRRSEVFEGEEWDDIFNPDEWETTYGDCFKKEEVDI